ncbi:MAG: SGNH/GDSL hydrolase family protein [Vicinamibacteria bacterium]|nr:SGNH/GDSL hydrolase family protein [Vicinamibacteria bacterium]
MTRRVLRNLGAFGLAVLLPGCGGGNASGPSPIPTVQPTQTVTVIAFLDENENGSFDLSEGTRIPNIEVVLGGVKARTTASTGQATVQSPQGTQTLEVTASSLPPFYRPPASRTITVSSNAPVMVPITLPRGSNRANVYMAFGDSITNGEPEVGDGDGYRRMLESMLRAHFGSAAVAREGFDGTQSDFGAAQIGSSLARVQPSFTLILYGTNDWNDSACRQLPCFTTSSLRAIVQQVNRFKSHAFLATITPSNTGFDNRAPASRNDWIAAQNALIKQVADDEGAVLVDLNAAFLKTGAPLSSLLVDHVHPSATGYQIMAQTWFDAITHEYTKILAEYD